MSQIIFSQFFCKIKEFLNNKHQIDGSNICVRGFFQVKMCFFLVDRCFFMPNTMIHCVF